MTLSLAFQDLCPTSEVLLKNYLPYKRTKIVALKGIIEIVGSIPELDLSGYFKEIWARDNLMEIDLSSS